MIINATIIGGSGASGELHIASNPLASAPMTGCVYNNELYVLCSNSTFWK